MTRSLRPRVHAQPGVGRPARKRLATSPLPADVREAVIEHLTALLVAEVERNPEAYLQPGYAGPEGGATVIPPPAECAAKSRRG